jgi:hypothetical protein
VTAALGIADAEITSRTTRFELPGAVSLGRGLRLLPADEYPAAGRSGTDRETDQAPSR